VAFDWLSGEGWVAVGDGDGVSLTEPLLVETGEPEQAFSNTNTNRGRPKVSNRGKENLAAPERSNLLFKLFFGDWEWLNAKLFLKVDYR
jgi:hypothetical protein